VLFGLGLFGILLGGVVAWKQLAGAAATTAVERSALQGEAFDTSMLTIPATVTAPAADRSPTAATSLSFDGGKASR
jgi:hypothetical protein